MINISKLTYVVTGMKKGELLPEYHPSFETERVDKMHSFLKKVNHHSFENSNQVYLPYFVELAKKNYYL